MILTSHAIIGVAVASAFPSHPILAFSVALASHYIADAIPHWEYDLLSSKKDIKNPLDNDITVGKDFFSDLMKVSADMTVGIISSVTILYFLGFDVPILILIAGIVGGIGPDFLQFAYFRFRHEPFKSLYLFHYNIHSRDKRLEKHFVIGIFLQVVIITSVILARIFFVR